MTNLIEKKKWTERKLKTIQLQKYWLSEIQTVRDKLETAKDYGIEDAKLVELEAELQICESMFRVETRIKNVLDKIIDNPPQKTAEEIPF